MKQIITLIVALCVFTTHNALAAEQVTYYHNNAVGSPVAATDETGALLWQQTYDLWGDPLVSGPVDPRAFTGAPRDAATGNSDLGARWYNPLLGRFLAPDPVGFHPSNIHSFNRYAYAANNPYVYVDPNGEIAIAALIWGAITVASTADTAYESYQTYQSDGITAAAAGAAINLIAGPLGKVKKIARAARKIFDRSNAVKNGTQSAKQAADLSRHLGYMEKYGKASTRELQNGRFRYYGELQPANKMGEMAGRRYVHEFNPATGRSRGWHETLDRNGNVRQVRPELNNSFKQHYQFDRSGNYKGGWK